MASYKPISGDVIQRFASNVAASGYYLKGYQSGTTTALAMGIDSTPTSTLAKCQINSEGYPINGSSAVFIPHFNQDYKLVLYTNSTDADADTFANAVYTIDGISVSDPDTLVSSTIETKLGSDADGSNKFTLTGITYAVGVNNLAVFRNGVRQQVTIDYAETSSTEVTLTYNPNDNDRFVFITNTSTTSSVSLASGVSYTPAGTGAVTTNVQAKLREHPSFDDFGAVGDGVTDDTSAVQLALDSGEDVLYVGGNYKLSSVTIPASVNLIYGPGTITQSATGNKSFVSTSNNLKIEGITFVGAATSGSASLNNDTAIEITGAENIRISNCVFKNYSYNTVYLLNCTDCHVHDNWFSQVGHAVRLRGCSRASITGNAQVGTILVSTAQSIPYGVDSTNGHAYGVCEDIVISNNRASNIPYGEGVLVHAGKRITITGNTFNKLSFGVGVNPFNATDTLEDVSIVGNTFEGTTSALWTTSLSSDADEAIFVGGAAGTTRPTGISISGNSITYFNHVVDQANQGGIVVGYSSNVSITGNSIRNCRGSGITVIEDSLNCVITGNAISDIQFNGASTLKNGIRLNHASARAFIIGNTFRSITGTNSYGVRTDSGEVRLGYNQFISVDDEIGDFGGTLLDKEVQSYTSGTTVDLNGTDIVEFDASGGAITIGTGNTVWSNVVHRKRYIFRNVGSSNNVTISRDATYCKCASGANVVIAPGESVEFIGGSAVNVVEQLTDKSTAIS